MAKGKVKRVFLDDMGAKNPVFMQLLGICSTLAVTNAVKNTVVMCLGLIFSTSLSALFVSLLRKAIPSRIRMMVETLIIAAFVIIVDMIGDADQQIYYERNSDQSLSERLWSVASEQGYGEVFVPEYRFSMLDDHTPFLERGIPAVDIIDFDYPYWHTTGDTLDKVSAESLESVGRTVQVFLQEECWRVTGQG